MRQLVSAETLEVRSPRLLFFIILVFCHINDDIAVGRVRSGRCRQRPPWLSSSAVLRRIRPAVAVAAEEAADNEGDEPEACCGAERSKRDI